MRSCALFMRRKTSDDADVRFLAASPLGMTIHSKDGSMRSITMLLAMVTVASAAEGQNKQVIRDPNAPTPPANPPARPATLSPAARAGNLIFVSGQLGSVADTALKGAERTKAETKSALENVRNTLQWAGVGMDKVVKCTVFLADIADF